MITVKKINKMGLLNHIAGYRGQVEIKDSKLLDKNATYSLRSRCWGCNSFTQTFNSLFSTEQIK